MLNHGLRAGLCAAALALGLAACGSSSSSSAPASSSPSPAARVTNLAISAAQSGQLMFSTKTLTAKAGTVKITFTNQAPEPHDIVVQNSSGKVLGSTPTFQGGSKVLTLKLTAGTYTYFCSVPGHEAGGMKGTLTVS